MTCAISVGLVVACVFPLLWEAASDGCGKAFLEQLSDFVGVETCEGCAALGGHVVSIQFDVSTYVARQLLPGESRGPAVAVRRLLELGAHEQLAWRSGLAACFPRSCQDPVELLPSVLTLATCLWGRCADSLDLEAPLMREEINVSFSRDSCTANDLLQEANALVAVSQVVQAHQADLLAVALARSQELAGALDLIKDPPSDTPYLPQSQLGVQCHEEWERDAQVLANNSGALAIFSNDDAMELFYAEQERCRKLEGWHGVFRFRARRYVDAWERSSLDSSTHFVLQEMSLRIKEFGAEEYWKRHGVGACLPACCVGDAQAAQVVALQYYGMSLELPLSVAMLLPVPAVDERWADFALPEHYAELWAGGAWQTWFMLPGFRAGGVVPASTVDALWGQGAVCSVGAASFAGGCAESFASLLPGDQVGAGAAGGALACSCVAHLDATEVADPEAPLAVSNWSTCASEEFPEEFHLLRSRIAASEDPASDPAVFTLADAIVQRHHSLGYDWAHRCNLYSDWCRKIHVHMDEYTRFLPFILFFDKEQVSWKSQYNFWKYFCAAGFAAALYYRGRALEAFGLPKLALSSFEWATKMSGPCQEIEVFDPVWRVSMLDVEMNIFRLRARNSDGRPIFTAEEKPRGPASFVSFEASFPTKSRLADNYIWSALRQNTLYRRSLQESAGACSAEALARAPSAAMVAWPAWFSVFLAPQFFALWPGMELALLHLGKWGSWSFPRQEMQLRAHVVEEQALLDEGVPMKESNPREIAWGSQGSDGTFSGFSVPDLTALLHAVFQESRRFLTASVLLCSAHLWFCMLLRTLTDKPMIIADLANPMQWMPAGVMPGPWYTSAVRGAFRSLPMSNKTLIVRDELLRAVMPTKGCSNAMTPNIPEGEMGCFDGTWDFVDFLPFVALPSLYVHHRWRPAHAAGGGEARVFLVMREGSAGKFSKTFRGIVFFKILEKLTLAASVNLRFLTDEHARLSWEELASFSAAISFPGITNAKRTPSDLYMLEMPLFFPSKILLATALSQTGYFAAVPCDDGPWRNSSSRVAVPPLCDWVRTAFQIQMSSFYRVPHLLHFSSAADLAQQLRAITDAELQGVSRAMHDFTERRVQDDLTLWRNAALSLTCGRGATASGASSSAGAAQGVHGLPLPAHANASDPHCLFGLLSADGRACCAISCGVCEDRTCNDPKFDSELCCPASVAASQRECSAHFAPCARDPARSVAAVEAGGTCMDHPAHCDPAVLRFAVHLDGPVLPLENEVSR